MKQRIAILDLGTNTFNLLIAEVNKDKQYTILVSEKRAVKLGEGGINKGEIIPEAIKRGVKAIDSYDLLMKEYGVKQIKAFGTSALRSASNGDILLSLIKDKTGIEVEIVSGSREAELIFKGVRQTLLLNDKKFLILDIGGGSNEFILADMNKIYWKKSYPLGIARILDSFNPSDPLTVEEEERITLFVKKELQDLFHIIRFNQVDTLVGASGSFETFVNMITESEVVETESETEAIANSIPLNSFNDLYKKLIYSTVNEREKMKGLEPMRIEMIVLATLFVKILFDKHPFKSLYQSNYALKEGAAFELVNSKH